ncbi:uncharacterized protein RJT20DRAFT_84203, partial [Scheffersomyces xylosifermentans]|uniref:uncharacterized protein n=1 Tax=Scheffersomyces xylosifermentans TaxID=1304137 RepID=UPI00315DFA23
KTPPTLSSLHYQDAQFTTDPLEVVEIINEQEIRNYRLGVLFIVVAISTWVIGLELVNSVLKGSDYSKPWMFAVITGSSFMLNLIPEVLQFITSLFTSLRKQDTTTEESTPLIESSSDNNYGNKSGARLEKIMKDDLEKNSPSELTGTEVFQLSFQMAVIYFLYNIFVMEALQFTSASNQTVLGSTTSIFTLFIGALLKIDRFTIKKVVCVCVSCFGVFLVNYSESSKEGDGGNKFIPKNPRLGNSLALCGALMYAFYLIVMKVKCGTGDKTTNERRLFGYVGVMTSVIGVPLLFVVHWLDIEKFEFPPPSNRILFSILINGVFSVISDYLTILAMLLTSPLVTSLSLTSALPITICIDYIIMLVTSDGSKTPSKGFSYFLGISSILLAVILINVNVT